MHISTASRGRIRHLLLAFVAVAALSAGIVVPLVVDEQPASAADLSAFDPGLIITDELFFDGDAMSASSIQSFLATKAGSCVSGGGYTCIDDYKASITARAANANCSAVSSKSGQTAATIIATVARACSISPKVLIVTLQKEQGLITAGPKSSGAYRIAMGYACPDAAACDTKYYGFFNQVYSAAWQFQQYTHSTSFNYKPGRVNTIKYHPSQRCGTVQVYIRNQATAGLYNYTPYVPNSAALAAGYGIGNSCSSYGNRNFYNYYSDWFGNPANALKNASFQNKTESWKSGSNGGVTYAAATDAAKAQSGSRYVNVSTSVTDRRFEQSITRDPSAGQVWEGGIWVRAADDGGSVTGALIITATGGTTESTTVPFTVGDVWTEISGQLGVEKSGHTGMRLSVRLHTVGTRFRLDSAALYVSAKQESRSDLKVEQTGIGTGRNGGWVRSSSSGITVKKGYAVGPVDGTYYLKAAASSAGKNVYQRISKSTQVGTAFTATAYVRSGKSGQDYTGRFVLLGMGGSAESVTTEFTVGSDEWTQVSATLDIDKPDHKSLRIYFYLDTPGGELLFDKITLKPDLLVRDPSFEAGTSALNSVPSGTTATRVAKADFGTAGLDGAPIDGRSSLVMTSSTAGTAYLRFDRDRVVAAGSTYTSSVWVRSADGADHDMRLVMSGMADGLVVESDEKSYTVGGEWTLISVSHTIAASNISRLRTDIRLESADAKILLDGAQLR